MSPSIVGLNIPIQGHETERKTFETKMKAEYKLKKERWKREMESQETPKSQRNQGNVVLKSSTHLIFAGRMILIFITLFLFFCIIIILGLVASGAIKADIEVSLTFHGRVKFVSKFLFGNL